jgi:uncharacterized protein (TIGR02246 family)
MRHIVAVTVVGVLSLTTASDAQEITGYAGNTPAEREVRAAEERMHQAYVAGDAKAFRSLYADDSTFTYSTGRTVGPDERVKDLRAFKNLRDEIVSIKMIGTDVALVRCISQYANATTPGESRITILRVWQKRDGQWKVIAFQGTPLTAAAK